MRIAIYHNLTSGGGKRALYELTRRLAKRHQIDVFTLETGEHVFGDLRPHVQNHYCYSFAPLAVLDSPFGRLNPFVRLLNLKRVSRINKQIALHIEAGKYDVVFVNPCQFEIAPSLLHYIQRTPTVYYCQEPPRIIYEEMPHRPYDKKISSWLQLLDRIDPLPLLYFWTLKNTDRRNLLGASKVLVNSHFMRESIRSIYAIDPDVCYLGTDVQLFHPNGAKKNGFLLSVGSLTPLKGFDFLLEAFASIPKQNRPKLLIASNFQNEPERDYLQGLAERLDIDLVLHDRISDEMLANLYNQTSITVYASIREPFGLVPLESMASGTPVVSVRDGGMQETILDGETGYLVERDPEIFANVIQRLLNDHSQIYHMGVAGREHVMTHWTWDKAAERFENILFHKVDAKPNN